MSEPGQITIRMATSDDLEGLTALFDGYRRFYGNLSDIEGARRFLAARLAASESVVFVAARAGVLVGFTQLYPSFSSGSMRRLWILNDLFVAPAARRNGIGGALMARRSRLRGRRAPGACCSRHRRPTRPPRRSTSHAAGRSTPSSITTSTTFELARGINARRLCRLRDNPT